MAEPDDTADLGLLSPVWVGTRAEAATSDRAVLDAMVAFETALSRALAEHDLAPAGEVVATRCRRAHPGPGGGRTGQPDAAAGGAAPGHRRRGGAPRRHQPGPGRLRADAHRLRDAPAGRGRPDGARRPAGPGRRASTGTARAWRARSPSRRCRRRSASGSRLARAACTTRCCWCGRAAAAGVAGRAGRHGGGVRRAGPAVVASLARMLGLSAPVMPWHTRRTPVLTLATALVATGEACGRIAADLLLMGQTEVGEAADGSAGVLGDGPQGQPHPFRAGRLRGAAAARALGSVVASAGAGASERPAGDWHAEWQPLRTMLGWPGPPRSAPRDRRRMQFDLDAMARTSTAPRPARPGRRLGRRADRARRGLGRPGAGPARGGDRMSVRLATARTVPRRTGGRSWPRRWAPRGRCGTGDRGAVPASTGWSASTPAATAARRCRPARTPSPSLAGDVLGVADALGIERFASSGCHWAAPSRRSLAHDAAGAAGRAGAVLHGAEFGEPAAWHERAAQVRA